MSNKKINILGSCVSRIALLDGDLTGHNIAGEDMELGYFLDKQNIICAMAPAPFSREEIDSITADELYESSRIKSLKQCLNKDTVDLLLNSDAGWLVIDFYDIQAMISVFRNTIFSNCACEFYNTGVFKKYENEVTGMYFDVLPTWIWYPYADLFFDKIKKKYDNDHIILNRFRSNTWYLSKNGRYERIPDKFKQPYHSNDKYNDMLKSFEDYIIKKISPYVIDISKYYSEDENLWDNLNGAHFEKEFYRETFDIISDIVNSGGSSTRYFSKTKFFDDSRRGYEEDKKRNFDVAEGFKMLELFLDNADPLWINILDKLNTYVPDDIRTKAYCEAYKKRK